MARRITQIAAVTGIQLRTVASRGGPLLVAGAGIAGCVAVLVGVLSIASGFEEVISGTGAADAAIVLRSGSDTEITSDLPLETARLVSAAPGVARGEAGALASGELFVSVSVPKRSTGTDVQAPLRGMERAGPEVRPGFRIVEGRLFEPGRYELVVGATAASGFRGLEVGTVKRWGETDWKIVGIFSTGGTAADSELWCDVNLLRPLYRRTSIQSVHARLESAGAFEELKTALARDARTPVRVIRQDEYYGSQSQALVRTVRGLASVLAALMSLCGGFAALSAMFATVASRSGEFATLQALGFGALPVVVSVVLEAVVLAMIAGLCGGIGVWVVLDGFAATTMNWQTYTQVGFTLRVDCELIGLGVAYAVAIGALGAVIPAVWAARLPLALALREE